MKIHDYDADTCTTWIELIWNDHVEMIHVLLNDIFDTHQHQLG